MSLPRGLLIGLLGFALVGCAGSRGSVYKVQPGDTLSNIAERLSVDELDLMSLNRLYSDADLTPGLTLRLPRARTSPDDEAVLPRLSPKSFRFQWPVPNPRVTDFFGWRDPSRRRPEKMHEGIDLGGNSRTPILAAAPGTVIFAGRRVRGYGRMVVVEHAESWSTVYAHLSKIDARVGQRVEAGDRLGWMGRSGRASGVHLHFEIRRGADPVDPMVLLPQVKN
jgi:murein DD-endopeptidase MepM/ murein hydrolase activator NlpD